MSTMKWVLPPPSQTMVSSRFEFRVRLTPLARICPPPNQLMVDAVIAVIPPGLTDKKPVPTVPTTVMLAATAVAPAGTVLVSTTAPPLTLRESLTEMVRFWPVLRIPGVGSAWR